MSYNGMGIIIIGGKQQTPWSSGVFAPMIAAQPLGGLGMACDSIPESPAACAEGCVSQKTACLNIVAQADAAARFDNPKIWTHFIAPAFAAGALVTWLLKTKKA